MTDKEHAIVGRVGDWYLINYGTYIRAYGATKELPFLPKFIPGTLVLQDIAYHTVIHVVGTKLYRDKKSIWLLLPLWVRY